MISLIELHQVPYQGTELENLGKGEGYCRRQVEGWDARYEKAKTLNVPSFKYVRNWLKDNIHPIPKPVSFTMTGVLIMSS